MQIKKIHSNHSNMDTWNMHKKKTNNNNNQKM